MPTYAYTARDQRGRAVAGTMAAASVEALADQLKHAGYLVTGSRERRAWLDFSAIRRIMESPPLSELVLFNVQLAKLIKVGIPLLTALRALEIQTTHRGLRSAIGDVGRELEAGSAFSDALARHPRIFSPLFISMVRAGEISGKLDEILTRLAEFSQREADLREQIKTALAYPLLLLVVGIGIMGFLVTSVIPKFMKVFLEAGVALPLPTWLLYQLSQVLRRGWLALLVVLAGAVWAACAYCRTPRGRKLTDTWLLRVPVIGPIARQAALARFSRTFETVASSGVPILEALTIVERTVGNVVLAEVVQRVHTNVRRGGSIAEPLQASGEFPPMAVQMITVGEASGTLDEMLGQLADHYDQMVRYAVKRSTAFIEPAFLAVMCGMVAFIMASVLLPLFQMLKVVHH